MSKEEKVALFEERRYDHPFMGAYGSCFPWVIRQYVRQDKCCFYCKKFVPVDEITKDHKIPKSKGGPNHHHNLILACHSCNQKKGATDFHEYLEKIKNNG